MIKELRRTCESDQILEFSDIKSDKTLEENDNVKGPVTLVGVRENALMALSKSKPSFISPR